MEKRHQYLENHFLVGAAISAAWETLMAMKFDGMCKKKQRRKRQIFQKEVDSLISWLFSFVALFKMEVNTSLNNRHKGLETSVVVRGILS